MICKIERYVGEKNIEIEHRMILDGATKPEGFIEYVGTVMVKIITNNGPINQPLQFKIDAKPNDIHDAFANVEVAANTRIEEVKKEQSRIQVANSLPPNMQQQLQGNQNHKKLIL